MSEGALKKRILVVDDDPTVIVLVTRFLESNGFDAVQAADGKEALTIIKQMPIDLIILDQMMPKMDGMKTCAMIKADKRFRSIPVIMFTASAEEKDRKLALEVGANSYCNKPLNIPLLKQEIQQLLKLL